MFKAIDLFAGIGGIRMGFENAFKNQIKTVYACEWDKYAQQTYKANFSQPETIAGDITQVKEEDVPQFDICLAGFPCVAFSIAGKRMGFDDLYHGSHRGILFMDVVRICDHHKPKVIFCENVKNLIRHDSGHTFEVIKESFEKIGYDVFYAVLNSKDFGVPQNRERVYIVCFRKDLSVHNFEFPNGQKDSGCIRDILEDAPIPARYYLSDTYVESLKAHKAKQASKGNGFGYVIRDLDGIAGTIVCGGMGRERNLIIDHRPHPLLPETHIRGKINTEDIRKMTPREWARLQGFPDDFKMPLADVHMYKQFGNSVSVNTIEAIARAIKQTLSDIDRG